MLQCCAMPWLFIIVKLQYSIAEIFENEIRAGAPAETEIPAPVMKITFFAPPAQRRDCFEG